VRRDALRAYGSQAGQGKELWILGWKDESSPAEGKIQKDSRFLWIRMLVGLSIVMDLFVGWTGVLGRGR
jgi:hypothetical protein